MSAVGIGLIDVDSRGVIVSAGITALELLGHPDAASVVGRSVHEALHAHTGHPEVCALQAAAESSTRTERQVDAFRRRDDTLLPVWWVAVPTATSADTDYDTDTDTDTRAAGGVAVIVFGDDTDGPLLDTGATKELADARRSVADLTWTAEITERLSTVLDEREILRRLADLTVAGLADVAIADLVNDDGLVFRVAGAAGAGVGIDVEAILDRDDITRELGTDSLSYRTVADQVMTSYGPEDLVRPELFSASSRQLLASLDAQNLMALRLTARQHVVGILALIRRAGSPPFDDVDALLGTDIGRRAALALDNARLYRAQSDIAIQLQRALLPDVRAAKLPVLAAARYLPARDRFDVGGDWYDLFRRTPDDPSLVIVVGDVAGHDLSAATIMAAVRNLLRGVIVATNGSPGSALTKVDANFVNLAISGTASALLIIATPAAGGWHFEWSNAGHLPPLLLLPDGSAELLDQVHGPIFGTNAGIVRASSTRTVPAGSTLVLYTDGLIENRTESIHDGLEHLLGVGRSLEADRSDPDAVADEILKRNQAGHEDDTALIVCHFPVPTPLLQPPPQLDQLEQPAQPAQPAKPDHPAL